MHCKKNRQKVDRLKKQKKTILILGAGTDQVFIIRTAKKMGLRVIVIDKNEKSPGFKEADFAFQESTRSIEKIFSILDKFMKEEGEIHGVSTMGSDIPHIVATIADYLNTPSISKNTGELATNKFEMKKQFIKHGVYTPSFILANNPQEIINAFKKLGNQLVIKPLDQAGSRGVSLIDKSSDITKLWKNALENSRSDIVIVEQFLKGPQISTESIVYDGRIYTPGFADRNYDDLETYLPQIMENGGWVPSLYNKKKEIIEKEVLRAANSIGLMRGVVKGDVVLTDNGPAIIEIAARLSGGDFSESLVPLGIGVNYVETVIRLALGEDPKLNTLEKKFDKTVANRYFFAPEGILKQIKGIECVKSKPWVAKLQFWYEIGQRLPKINSHGSRSGVFVVVGENRKLVQERINWVYEKIEFVIEDF